MADATSVIAPGTTPAQEAEQNAALGDATAENPCATMSYVDNLVTGLFDDRGNYNASVNTWPATGGSGAAGAILKGDVWLITVSGTLGGAVVEIGDSIRALADSPGQTASNWCITSRGLGFVPAAVDDARFPTADQKAAMAGTSGTAPSGTNKLVDAADTRLSDARQLPLYATVAAAEAASPVADSLYYCLETATGYRVIAAGSGYTRNGTSVLNHGSGGNYRALGRFGRYLVDGQTATGPLAIPDIALTIADGTATPNFALNNNFTLTLDGTNTLANPSNPTVGQSGRIVIRQPAAGAKTLAFGTYYLFEGGVDPTISSTANAVHVLYYDVLSATEIACVMMVGLA